jgi:ABC transport system ATP-binding/permease protein
MKIRLSEIRNEQKLATREFNQATIKLGRDPQRCDVVFEQEKWLMVSRTHAEIRLQDGRCFLIDLNSRQGTFLNGERVIEPTEISTGGRIQLGEMGPVLSVDLVPDDAAAGGFANTLVDTPVARHGSRSHPPPAKFTPQTTAGMAPPPSKPQRSAPLLILESGQAGKKGPQFELNSEKTILGRDVAADVQVEGAAPVVSRRHAEIRREPNGSFLVVDLNSFNGTLVNNYRITQPTVLHDADLIQLSVGGPILRFVDQGNLSAKARQSDDVAPPPAGVNPFLTRPMTVTDISEATDIGQRTIVLRPEAVKPSHAGAQGAKAQLLLQVTFDGKRKISVGRAPGNDIQLDALLISNHHARFIRGTQGVIVEDAGSTNGVYINGTRVTGSRPVQREDVIQIGPFLLTADAVTGVAVFDTRSQVRVDAVGITDIVASSKGQGETKLLDAVSLAIEPNEFVGLLGSSGAGKSVLMNALNGTRQTSGGRVFINHLDLHQHLYSLKQSIGHVPQDDIIHRELTPYRTLYYVARLRLSRDVPREEIDEIITEVLEVTGLTEKRDVPISQLSGGQRKRVSIAVELITRPSIIFLDEPTSGLDPATESRIMKLFRQIAESGRTVILSTHAMENVQLFDKVALLMRGKLVFYGTPNEALEFVGVGNFIDLYTKLEQPIESETAKLPPLPNKATKAQRNAHEEHRNQIADAVAEEWRLSFMRTDVYKRHVAQPLSQLRQQNEVAAVFRPLGVIDSLLQWSTLVRRYAQVLVSDKLNLLILLAQAPIIALLTYLVVGKEDPRDFPFFVLALVPVWFGTSVAAREIVKERSVYARERMVNLGLLPYVTSKLFALCCIVSLQCLMLFLTLKIPHYLGLMYLPGLFGGLGQVLTMILTGMVGVGLGLFVSALVKTPETATSIVPLILIPQILLCGLVGLPVGLARVVGAAMPATWSFDQMKQLSTLDTLREQGSRPSGENRGRGLYKHIEEENAANMALARQRLEEYQRESANTLKEYEREMKEYLSSRVGSGGLPVRRPPVVPTLKPAPSIPDPDMIKDDLSGYVSFMHPWGNLVINPVVLLFMLFSLIVMTLVALRVKDTG